MFKARNNSCYLVIHKNDLGDEATNDFIYLGDLFLQHFYSVYDLDKDEVSLGVNVHSQGKVLMYPPGNRPSV